jgi:hypothetical protein
MKVLKNGTKVKMKRGWVEGIIKDYLGLDLYLVIRDCDHRLAHVYRHEFTLMKDQPIVKP